MLLRMPSMSIIRRQPSSNFSSSRQSRLALLLRYLDLQHSFHVGPWQKSPALFRFFMFMGVRTQLPYKQALLWLKLNAPDGRFRYTVDVSALIFPSRDRICSDNLLEHLGNQCFEGLQAGDSVPWCIRGFMDADGSKSVYGPQVILKPTHVLGIWLVIKVSMLIRIPCASRNPTSIFYNGHRISFAFLSGLAQEGRLTGTPSK
jgi:hypothetical protein